MDERRQNKNISPNDSIYGIGRTQPPKNHGGLVAFLMIIIILLCGVTSVLGFLNVQLANQLHNPAESSLPLHFSLEDAPGISAHTDPTDYQSGGNQESVQLQPSPTSEENLSDPEALSWQEVYSRNIPSVVSIQCSSLSGNISGTGVVLTQDGYIVTNYHVVEDADSITVRLTSGSSYAARLIGADKISDLAVLHIDAKDLTPAVFGDSNALRVGDAVVAIGDPLGLQFHGSMTDGIVSAINRDVTVSGRPMTLIQTNAALNSGNSGGPLINCYGQVVGINTMKISTFVDEAGVEGLGFAIPSTTVTDIVNQLIQQGYVSGRPTLGIRGEEVSSFYQHYYRIPGGLYITQVAPNSSAAAQGIGYGDILVSIDGVRVTDQTTLENILYSHSVGDQVEVLIYRTGKEFVLTLTLTEYRG